MKNTGIRFKTLKDAQAALKTNDFSKALKRGKKGWRNARYEIGFMRVWLAETQVRPPAR